MATYKVVIMGKEYVLTSEENKDYTERLAAALDKRIKDMRARFSSLSITDCAVLTALDCMDELGQANRNIDNIRTQIKDYVDDAGRARNQATGAQREIKILKERVEQLEKELAERTNFSAMNNVGEAVSAEDILKGDIKAAIGETSEPEAVHAENNAQRRSIQDSPYMRSYEQAMNKRPADGAAGGARFSGNDQGNNK
ncbi:cell division protein ZapA [Ruminococcus albus]|jgi:cell division protein ZapA|uniref:Cell division protein ZapA n=1 Tax=Ruminococcus albus SY3 TaxID=1341156 RepID=A0A011W1D5_RUMAL|nr:cell division protein ZapA [Ruminococcus albus]EXM40643.1 cell division protein ZapA [Ruminococcus albus SY3]